MLNAYNIIIVISIFVAGHSIGKIRAYLKSRRQCPDCGSFNTCEVSSVWGGVKGGEYKYAIKNWEYHMCKDCDARMTVKMEKVLDHVKNKDHE